MPDYILVAFTLTKLVCGLFSEIEIQDVVKHMGMMVQNSFIQSENIIRVQHSTSPFQFIYKILDRVLYEFKSVYNRANIHHFDKSSGNFCSLLK